MARPGPLPRAIPAADDAPRLQRDSIEPIYLQLAGWLARTIRDGELRPGDRLPSEQALMAHWGASRVTVRQAIRQLGREGLVVSRQGKGTFVTGDGARAATADPSAAPDSPAGLAHVRQPCAVAGGRLLGHASGLPAGPLLRPLCATATRVERLLVGDDGPWLLADIEIAELAGPLSRDEVGMEPSSEFFERRTGLRIEQVDVDVRAVPLDVRACALLGLPQGAWGLEFERVSRLGDGRACERSRLLVPAATHAFTVSLDGATALCEAIRRVGPARPT